MLSTTDLAPLLQAIAQRERELIGFTQELVRIPTVNPPGEIGRAHV